jgi:PadR family transcriptional regulator, regulatory protein PadR
MPSRRLEEKLTKENLWLYILSLLTLNDMYGYELREAIREKFGFKPGNVTAYRVLYSLKLKGLVEIVAKKSGGRERKYYRITKAGKEELEKGKRIISGILIKL